MSDSLTRRPQASWAGARATRPRKAATTLLSSLLLAIGVASLAAGLLGVRLVPVLTGSMTPFATPGSLAVAVPVEGRQLHVGDVVAFRPPVNFQVSGERPIMHRVATVDATGPKPWLSTKGDANRDPDPWRIALDGTDFARTVLVVPAIGSPAAGGRWAVALLLAGALLLWIVRPTLVRADDPCTCPGDSAAD